MIVKYHEGGYYDVLHFTLFKRAMCDVDEATETVRDGVEDPMFECRIACWHPAKNLASDLDEASSWGAPSLRANIRQLDRRRPSAAINTFIF